ncbi:MAG: prolyl oligopeptidase family serine peptidase, partial [Verrucomicrobia bacterium]|nr:prolyl oligopeptidase family serine peptidase [Verrucomicrobiota bacterium]
MHIRIPHYTIFAGILSILLLGPLLNGQSDEQIANYFKRNPQADLNGDGKLTIEEARAHRRQTRQPQQNNRQSEPDPTQGDNLASTSHIAGIKIPESVSPIIEVPLRSDDGIDLSFAYRKPPGDGPYPTILFFHGGGGQSNLKGLKQNLKTGAVQTRFLKEGFAVVASTRRPYWKTKDNPDKVGYFDSVKDASLVIEKAKTLPGIDPENVVLYGGSGGAILAIGAASKNELACVIAGEPATVLLLAQMTSAKERPNYTPIMQDPLKFYKGAVKENTFSLFKTINCPILLLQGDTKNTLDKINNELLIPELKSLNKDVSSIRFPGLGHGFYWGTVKTGVNLETVNQIVRDVTAYIG